MHRVGATPSHHRGVCARPLCCKGPLAPIRHTFNGANSPRMLSGEPSTADGSTVREAGRQEATDFKPHAATASRSTRGMHGERCALAGHQGLGSVVSGVYSAPVLTTGDLHAGAVKNAGTPTRARVEVLPPLFPPTVKST